MGERKWQINHRGRAWREGPNRKVEWRSHVAWSSVNGPVPAGHEIHHLDLDRLNDDPANLIALTPEAHKALHRATIVTRPCQRCQEDFDQHALGSYAIYCTSCRTALDKEQQRAADRRRSQKLVICRHCGEEFRTRSGTYCSQRCVNLGARHPRVQPVSGGSS